jgi:hypothetical protein
MGFRQIVVEGDALEIVKALNREAECMGNYGQLVDCAKTLLNSAGTWEAQHVKRSGNGAAHCLAKYALNCNEEYSWHLECPSCIQDVVLGEKVSQ